MYRTGLSATLASSHFLSGASLQESKEHSHDYLVEVTVSGSELDGQGYLVNIDLLKAALDSVLGRYRGRCLNQLPEFASAPPSLENLSREVYDRLRTALSGRAASLAVRIWEDREAWAGYEGPG